MKLNISHLKLIRKLYYKEKMSMSGIAQHFSISLDAVVYFMRKHKIKRRNLKEANACMFNHKPLSFRRLKNLTSDLKSLKSIGTMLYWCEGYKGSEYSRNNVVDFANCDPAMVYIFLIFLRKIYRIDESRLRILLYCYSNQNVKDLIKYWSSLTKIPASQFTKPYIRNDYRTNGRIMPYGMVHIRYNDKKLLSEIKNLIESCKSKYAPIV
jgi:hypothetical protein